jgi:hypothetical protein
LLRDAGFRLVFEDRREVEGDQFHVNPNRPGMWQYLALRRTRAFAGRVKRRILRPFSP